MAVGSVLGMLRTTGMPICGNIAVSVCLIITNKALMRAKNFDFTMTLTLLHFLLTGITMRILSAAGVFQPKHVPARTMALFALSGVGSIIFNNLTLQYNSVGLYQLMKLCCVPATVAAEYFIYGKRFGVMLLLSLLVLLVGISGATVTDVEFNWLGWVFGVISVGFTTWYQIWIGTIQSTHELSQLQLLHSVTPYWIGMTALLALQVDVVNRMKESTPYGVLSTEFDSHMLLLTAASCTFAVGVNFSGFLLINVTSALTYMVVGHAKTLMILSSAFILFHSPVTAANLTCILIAFVGVCMYGYFKTRPTEQSKQVAMQVIKGDEVQEDDEEARLVETTPRSAVSS